MTLKLQSMIAHPLPAFSFRELINIRLLVEEAMTSQPKTTSLFGPTEWCFQALQFITISYSVVLSYLLRTTHSVYTKFVSLSKCTLIREGRRGALKASSPLVI